MSYGRETTIWCQCGNWARYSTGKVSEARKLARKEGWIAQRGHDVCSLCVQKMKETKVNPEQVGEMIRNRRLVLGLSLQALSQSCGAAPRTIATIEAGAGGNMGSVHKILQALGLRLNIEARPEEDEP